MLFPNRANRRGFRPCAERAATIDKILSPLSDCEQKEIVAVMAKIVAVVAARPNRYVPTVIDRPA